MRQTGKKHYKQTSLRSPSWQTSSSQSGLLEASALPPQPLRRLLGKPFLSPHLNTKTEPPSLALEALVTETAGRLRQYHSRRRIRPSGPEDGASGRTASARARRLLLEGSRARAGLPVPLSGCRRRRRLPQAVPAAISRPGVLHPASTASRPPETPDKAAHQVPLPNEHK